ncbi:ATP synthase subunit delta [Aureliella helgolandensis]|uniref:ATP synthase subunit delta n=2 Tax=Aureliella helgolandensis TaxID=2527968 RepID=A0A518GE61_9BACT|nr:ATP synthase subunit delta [Aureliella helgolandensis]
MTEISQHETVLDSDQQQVGGLYAKALLAAAGDSVDHIVGEFEAVVKECLDTHPNLEQALSSPRITQEQKESMLDRIFNGRINGTLLNFIKILCRRGRIDSLRAIQVTSKLLREEQLGKTRVSVTSAQPLNDDQRHQIAERLRQAYGREAVLVESVDAGLMGGIVLKIGDQVLDGSASGKLDSLKSAVTDGVQRAIRDRYESLLSN